jgi:hypothetical protein
MERCTLPPSTQSNDGWTSLANQSWTVASSKTGASAATAGSTTLSMSSVANLSVGQGISGTGIAAGTQVAAVNTGNISIALSLPITASIPAASPLLFGSLSASASSAEIQRQVYNAYLRGHSTLLGCNGIIDDDSIFADAGGSGKWRVDLGSASADGVHPSAALHQAAVNAGLITSGMFPPT